MRLLKVKKETVKLVNNAEKSQKGAPQKENNNLKVERINSNPRKL